MPVIHFVLQGKGGVGKSMAAALMAQYKINQGHSVLCIDTDPVNATFSGYTALSVHPLAIMEHNEINTRSFDVLVQLIANQDKDVIIDNGASSFIPLSNYLISNQIASLFHEKGFSVVIHTLITGGQAFLDTLNGFAQLVQQFPANCAFVVWLNPYWGAIESEGKPFEQMKSYLDHKERVTALIPLPTLKQETFGHDFTQMLQARKTFEEMLNDSSLTIMTRQRIKLIKEQLFALIAQTGIFS